MKSFIILILFFLTSCSSNMSRNDFNITNEMSFLEFKIKLNKYAENNPYPNINK
jgi:hypothetical protein